MKFYLFLLLTLLIKCIYSNETSSESGSESKLFNYIKTNMFLTETCDGVAPSAAYLLLNICGFEGISRVICLDDGTIENIIYSEQGCQGEIKERIKVEPNNCTNSETYQCVESIEVPNNSYQVWYTHSTCENDPNWKDDVWQFAYTLTDTCLSGAESGNPAGLIQCKNTDSTTIAIENIYNSTTTCNPSENTGYKYLTLPPCNNKKSPMFSKCT